MDSLRRTLPSCNNGLSSTSPSQMASARQTRNQITTAHHQTSVAMDSLRRIVPSFTNGLSWTSPSQMANTRQTRNQITTAYHFRVPLLVCAPDAPLRQRGPKQTSFHWMNK